MANKKIKAFNSRYSKLLKPFNFMTINIICLAYVEIFSEIQGGNKCLTVLQ